MVYIVYGFNIVCDCPINKYSKYYSDGINEEFPVIKVECCKNKSDIFGFENVKNAETDCQPYFINNEYHFDFRDGRSVVVSKDQIKMYGGDFDERLLGGADIVALSKMNNRAVLHGGAFFYKGKAYLICAESGAGKSTLSSAMAFYHNDIDILTDDIICISTDGASIYTGLSQISLNGDSYTFFFGDSNRAVLNTKRIDKKTYTLSKDEEFASGKYSIGGVFFLKGRIQDGIVEITGLNRADSFLETLKNIKMKNSINSEIISTEIGIINNMVNNYIFGVSLKIIDSFSGLNMVTDEIIAYIDGNNHDF